MKTIQLVFWTIIAYPLILIYSLEICGAIHLWWTRSQKLVFYIWMDVLKPFLRFVWVAAFNNYTAWAVVCDFCEFVIFNLAFTVLMFAFIGELQINSIPMSQRIQFIATFLLFYYLAKVTSQYKARLMSSKKGQ